MQAQDDTFPIVKRLLSENAAEYAPKYAVAFIFMGIVAGTTALTAYMMKDTINLIFVERSTQALTWIPMAIAAIFLVKGIAAYFQEVILSRIGNRLVAQMQKRLFEHILKMDMAFFQKNASGELITSISYNTRGARDMMNLLAVGLGRDVLTVLGLVVVMVMQDPIMSMVLLFIGPVSAIVLKSLSEKIKKAARSETSSVSTIISAMRETVQGVRIVKSFQLENTMQKRMDTSIEAVERLNNRIVGVKARVNPLMETMAGFAIAAVVTYAGWRTLQHGQTPGEFFAFITALLLTGEPLRRLSRLHLQLTSAAVQVRMIYTLLDTPAAEKEQPNKLLLIVDGGEVRFDNVAFSYDQKTDVLQNLSLLAPAGKMTALVGLSGSGKTTILNLVQRLWVPQSGTIYIDGQDISTVSLDSLRRQISLVSQDVFLFEGTIKENLVTEDKKYTEEDIIAAAKAAHADDFIRDFPKGYDTPVGELGGMLSGGQRQRISIARAFLKNSPIILLDEPTSALDSETERHIQAALKKLTLGRTTIVIAHRLATVARADIIHVLESGRLAESGTQRELLLRDGLYSKLHRIQFDQLEAS
ncbi:MAG: ABC transporter [Hyphomicrobium sp.]|nr:MAG: ABC transporter [Hyphomicrobium sp.]